MPRDSADLLSTTKAKCTVNIRNSKNRDSCSNEREVSRQFKCAVRYYGWSPNGLEAAVGGGQWLVLREPLGTREGQSTGKRSVGD